MEKLQISPGCDESALKKQVSNIVSFLTLEGFSLALLHSAVLTFLTLFALSVGTELK